MNNNNKNTSIVLTDEITDFFNKKRIKMSPFIRDLIEDSEEYKRWKDGKNG